MLQFACRSVCSHVVLDPAAVDGTMFSPARSHRCEHPAMQHDHMSSQREAVCAYCAHGRLLHDGPPDAERRKGGWCRACEDRRPDGVAPLKCRWFE